MTTERSNASRRLAEKGDSYEIRHGQGYSVCTNSGHRAIGKDKTVRSAVGFFRRATTRSDVDAILRDLAKL